MLINYPHTNFKIEEKEGIVKIWDSIRKKWLVFTPEEWVRQNFIAFLISMHIPSSLIAIEKEIKYNDAKKRFDIVVYTKAGTPWMLIECKKNSDELTQKALEQVLSYQSYINTEYIILTNGSQTMGWHISNNKAELMNEFPVF
jgi:hypothetical protein